MSKPNLDNSRDAALYVFRVFQDILKSAADKLDLNTVKTILPEFDKLFRDVFEHRTGESVEILKLYLQRTEDTQARADILSRVAKQEKRDEIVKRLKLGRDQVLYGLAAWVLDKYAADRENRARKALFEEVVQHLPSDLPRLTSIRDSLSDRDPADYWGWDWWDLRADGEAHFVDTFTKPNRLYCVKALRILGPMSAEVVQQIRLPHSRSLAYLAQATNNQGLVHMLSEARTNPNNWSWLLSEQELDKIPALEALLEKSKQDEEADEEERLIVAVVDEEKLDEFKQNIIDAVQRFGRLRPLFDKLGMLNKIVDDTPRKQIPSWGYNQIDDKGAFIKDWHVSYGGWGESYGRGLGQAEDQHAFEALIAGATTVPSISKLELFQVIEQHIRSHKMSSPVVMQSLDYMLETSQIRNRENFIPHYHPECPATPLTGLDGFMGVLKLDGRFVPVFDVFVHGEELSNRVLIADLPKFARWDQYLPVDEPGDSNFVLNHQVYIRVRDLNIDGEIREKILAENPEWLSEKADKERYLRQHVVVNVYEKLALTILESKLAVSFSLTDIESEES